MQPTVLEKILNFRSARARSSPTCTKSLSPTETRRRRRARFPEPTGACSFAKRAAPRFPHARTWLSSWILKASAPGPLFFHLSPSGSWQNSVAWRRGGTDQGQHSSAEKGGGVHHSMRLSFTVWWMSGTSVKSSNRGQKKSLFSGQKVDVKKHRIRQQVLSPIVSWPCYECGMTYKSSKALASHQARSHHKERLSGRYVKDGACPFCARRRAMHHVDFGSKTCKARLLSSPGLRELTEEEVALALQQDRLDYAVTKA